MLIPESITVTGAIQSPDWLALGHVPRYITQLHPTIQTGCGGELVLGKKAEAWNQPGGD